MHSIINRKLMDKGGNTDKRSGAPSRSRSVTGGDVYNTYENLDYNNDHTSRSNSVTQNNNRRNDSLIEILVSIKNSRTKTQRRQKFG
eukprot:UN18441